MEHTDADPLDTTLFLVGNWHGEGKSPFGPYTFKTSVTRRGRWLLSLTHVHDPKSGKEIFLNTWVYGTDDKGALVCHVFDTAGVFVFTGRKEGNSLYYEWKDGDAWRRFRLVQRDDGKVDSRYEAHVPTAQPVDWLLEGVWLPNA